MTKARAAFEIAEGLAQGGFHGGGIEVAGDRDDHVVGQDGLVVEGLQVSDSDGLDGGELRLAGVGRVCAVDHFGGFAAGDAGGVIVLADDAGFDAAAGELEFDWFECGMEKEVESVGKDEGFILFQARPAERGGGDAAGGLDGGGLFGELLVERVAGDGGGAAGAPGVAVDLDEAGLAASSSREPPRMVMEPSMTGRSWSSARKMTRPLSS